MNDHGAAWRRHPHHRGRQFFTNLQGKNEAFSGAAGHIDTLAARRIESGEQIAERVLIQFPRRG
ncbi:MAG TPA: hypothetical protein PLP26_10595, partial [Ilumatobacteraceae bacterium]|nr:hypothetical protein [Ilumatobacteraceae bacterium]